MGLLDRIKNNSRCVSDACAGSKRYFELATTNLTLYRALRGAVEMFCSGRLLDAGAGRLAYRDMLRRHCDAYESLDIAEGDGIDHVADLQDCGLPDDAYDTVVCSQVLHHLPEPHRALAEIARVLRPEGVAVITVPHLSWLHNEPHDYWRFTCHGVRHLLREAGLEDVRIEPLGGWVCFLAYPVSTLALAALWPAKPLFRIGLFLNRLFIRAALLLDRWVGVKSLYPTNYLVVARKARSKKG